MNRLRVVLIMILPVLLGVGPCTGGPRMIAAVPGGVLTGQVATRPVTDFSFVADAGLCALETRPDFPHSVTVNCFNDGPDLYVGCMGCEDKVWSTYVANDSSARIRIADTVYAVTMNRITDPEEMAGPWLSRWQKARGNTDAPRIPEGYWLYRLTSR